MIKIFCHIVINHCLPSSLGNFDTRLPPANVTTYYSPYASYPHFRRVKYQFEPSMTSLLLHVSKASCRLPGRTTSKGFSSKAKPLSVRYNSDLFYPTAVHSPSRKSSWIKARISLSANSIRHCSHRRTMCRHAEGVEGSANATGAREVLPTNVKPVHYDLTLEPDFEKFTYEGTVVIEYVWKKP